jgi:hypothetical protein
MARLFQSRSAIEEEEEEEGEEEEEEEEMFVVTENIAKRPVY